MKVMLKISLHILFSLFVINSHAQKKYAEHIIENEKLLAAKFKELRAQTKNKDFIEKNKVFIEGLKVMLKEDEAFTYPFDSLTTMSKITSPDKAFRLFNWNVEMEGGYQKFYCFILKKDGKIIELKDRHQNMIKPEHKSCSDKNWYGAVYYEIIPLKGKKYTLLGWNGKDGITTQKVIEVMSLGSKKAKFGATVFKFENSKERKRRFILEYSDDAYVSLKYQKTKKTEQIIFSHLSPATPQMEGFYQYYYPDLSYDSFKMEDGKWVYQSSVDARNNASEADKKYINPYDPNNPVEGGRRR